MIEDILNNAALEYQASAEFRDTVFQMVVEDAFSKLDALTIPTPLANNAALRGQAVAWACYDWLHVHNAGAPYLPIVNDAARDDARFWAETAQPAELECYALAAVDRLAAHNAPFVSRQIKRLIAALWARMAPSEREAFLKWLAE